MRARLVKFKDMLIKFRKVTIREIVDFQHVRRNCDSPLIQGKFEPFTDGRYEVSSRLVSYFSFNHFRSIVFLFRTFSVHVRLSHSQNRGFLRCSF